MERQINTALLRKLITNNKSSFPKVLSRLNISKNKDDIKIGFFSNGVDVTNHFMLNSELFEIFINTIQSAKLEDGDYFYAPKYAGLNRIFTNPDIFFRLRLKKGIPFSDLEAYANVNRATIQQLEKSEPFDPSLSTMLKYSIFFKHPLYDLLAESYKKETLNIILNHFIEKGYIEESKAKEIFEKESSK